MVEKLFDLWYAIPREREWWIDKISALLSGCSTGCFTLFMLYLLTVAVAVAVSWMSAKNTTEAFTMGAAWGTGLWLMVGPVGGSAVLAIVSRLRGA